MDEPTIYSRFKQALADGRIPKDRKLFQEILDCKIKEISEYKVLIIEGSRIFPDYKFTYCTREDMIWFMARVKAREELLNMFE